MVGVTPTPTNRKEKRTSRWRWVCKHVVCIDLVFIGIGMAINVANTMASVDNGFILYLGGKVELSDKERQDMELVTRGFLILGVCCITVLGMVGNAMLMTSTDSGLCISDSADKARIWRIIALIMTALNVIDVYIFEGFEFGSVRIFWQALSILLVSAYIKELDDVVDQVYFHNVARCVSRRRAERKEAIAFVVFGMKGTV